MAVSGSGVPAAVDRENDMATAASTSGTQDGEKKTKVQRAKHKCPFPTCSANVVNLPRHMIQVHKWAKEDTVGIVNAFTLRKSKKGSEKSTSVVKRLHNHLTDFHGMERGSKTYKKCLKSAVPHKLIELSSESTWESTSTDEEERLFQKNSRAEKRIKKRAKKEKHESIFKQVYSSEDEDDDNDNCPPYPSIFKRLPSDKERGYSDELPDTEEPERDELPERDGMLEKDEMSEEWFSEEQETVDQYSSGQGRI